MTIIETAVIPAARPQRITLTGSAGAIGQIVGPALLQRGHFVRGFDCRAALNLNEAVVANLVDPAAVARAVRDRAKINSCFMAQEFCYRWRGVSDAHTPPVGL